MVLREEPESGCAVPAVGEVAFCPCAFGLGAGFAQAARVRCVKEGGVVAGGADVDVGEGLGGGDVVPVIVVCCEGGAGAVCEDWKPWFLLTTGSGSGGRPRW